MHVFLTTRISYSFPSLLPSRPLGLVTGLFPIIHFQYMGMC